MRKNFKKRMCCAGTFYMNSAGEARSSVVSFGQLASCPIVVYVKQDWLLYDILSVVIVAEDDISIRAMAVSPINSNFLTSNTCSCLGLNWKASIAVALSR